MKEKAEDDGCPSGLRASRFSTIIGLLSQRKNPIEHNGQTEDGGEMLKGQRQPNALAINSREDPSANWQKREGGGGGGEQQKEQCDMLSQSAFKSSTVAIGERGAKSGRCTGSAMVLSNIRQEGCPARSRGPAFDVIIPDRDAAASERVWSLTFERMQNGH